MSVDVMIEKELSDFRLNVELKSKSRRIGILGASGCGKSMTLKCIAGIETPKRGQIEVDGRVLFQSTGNRIRDSKNRVNLRPQRRNVGYLFQDYALFPTMTVEANIAAGLRGNRNDKLCKVAKMMEKFQLNDLKERLPGEISGGQQQRVALARIMVYEPDVILLDEPFSALDDFLKDRLQQELIEMLKDYSGTVILVSHNRDEIYRFSEELLILDAGTAICQGRTKELFANPGWKEAARLTGCKNIIAIERINAHKLWIPEWKVLIELTQEIPVDVRYLGVRAHDFIPIWSEKMKRNFSEIEKNCIPVYADSMAELPFERKYFLRSANSQKEICWFVQRNFWKELDRKGLPSYLMIPEEKLLLLK